MSGIYTLARPLLFSLDAERAHARAVAALARYPRLLVGVAGRTIADPLRLMGLDFRNRIGLAAGFDKNGECIEACDRLGFGFIEIGTVTPRPQPGNPRPRMFRLARQRAIINRLGFNNQGVDALVARAARVRRRAVLGINIGKNADTPLERAEDDYLICLNKVYPVADYIAVNISSPNTVGLRDLQTAGRFEQLIVALTAARDRLAQRYGKRRPLLIKIAPDLEFEQLIAIADTARERGVDGLIATNTTITRPGFGLGLETGFGLGPDGAVLATEAGGLSGAPLRPLADAVLAQLRSRLGPDFPLIGVGGVMSAADAAAKHDAGANLVQIYTGLVYGGPGLIPECARALARRAAS